MIIDILDLNRKRVSMKKVHLVYNEESFYDEGEAIEFIEPVTVDGELTLTGDIINLDARVTTNLSLPCSRCLTTYSHPIDIHIHEKFSGSSLNEDDEVIFIDGDTIDIADVIKNNIITSLPIKKLCKEDCKGLCQNCGKNLNISSCDCIEEDIDPRLAELKKLFSAD